MSHISDWNNRYCFAWAVERPVTNRIRYSPKFKFNNEPHSLEFKLSDQTYCIHLRYEGSYGQLVSCNITIHVEDRKRCALPLSSYRYIRYDELYSKPVWSYPQSEILKAVPDFLTNGLVIFLVTLDYVDYYKYCTLTLKPPIRKEAKSIQTEEESIYKEDKSAQTPSCFSVDPCLKDPSTDLSNLLEQDSRPDVVLACGELNLVENRAHKNVLSCRSRVFSAMLRNDIPEVLTGKVQISDMDPGIFQAFVRYLYTGKLPDLNEHTTRRLYEAADKYAVVGLQKRCANFLLEILSHENACEMLVLADAHSDQDFKEGVLVYILQEEIPLADEQWLPFCKRQPLLANEVLNRFYKLQKSKQQINS